MLHLCAVFIFVLLLVLVANTAVAIRKELGHTALCSKTLALLDRPSGECFTSEHCHNMRVKNFPSLVVSLLALLAHVPMCTHADICSACTPKLNSAIAATTV